MISRLKSSEPMNPLDTLIILLLKYALWSPDYTLKAYMFFHHNRNILALAHFIASAVLPYIFIKV